MASELTNEEIKAAAKAELRRAIEAAKAEYKRTIEGVDAIERLKKKMEQGPGRPKAARSENGLASGILKILPSMDSEFTLDDLESKLREVVSAESINRSSVATAVRRLLGHGIETAEEGSGKKPARYRKLSA